MAHVSGFLETERNLDLSQQTYIFPDNLSCKCRYDRGLLFLCDP
jgi:hypothetical protein